MSSKKKERQAQEKRLSAAHRILNDDVTVTMQSKPGKVTQYKEVRQEITVKVNIPVQFFLNGEEVTGYQDLLIDVEVG